MIPITEPERTSLTILKPGFIWLHTKNPMTAITTRIIRTLKNLLFAIFIYINEIYKFKHYYGFDAADNHQEHLSNHESAEKQIVFSASYLYC